MLLALRFLPLSSPVQFRSAWRPPFQPIRDVRRTAPEPVEIADIRMSRVCASYHRPIWPCGPQFQNWYFPGLLPHVEGDVLLRFGELCRQNATHARFDEGMNDLAEPPPNARLLQHLADGHAINPDTLAVPPLSLEVSDDPFERLDEHTQPIICEHPTLGFQISECHIRRRGYVSGIVPNTSAARIRNVRRRYVGAFVVSVNGSSVFTSDSVVEALHTVVASDSTSFTIVFAPDRYIPVNERRPEQPLHLSVDQLQRVLQTNLGHADRRRSLMK